MALPFYVVAASERGIDAADTGILLAAQTAGALMSNPLWGWLGDGAGKRTMLRIVAFVRMIPPVIVLGLLQTESGLVGFVLLVVVIRGDDEGRDHGLSGLPDGNLSR
ncbi:MFS transporter [Thioclava sp. DLFJ4-1]|uniref:MFS transporter n=1 Tax=Thioclava sp. DLFJ4-1 TaxID=1915313 RepID=UPI00117EBD9C|nr:MFS transporter [Thioclava sp. DLFJ4-1]